MSNKTQLMSQLLISLAIVVSFLETNHSIAASILLSKNEVPFFKTSLLFGSITILLLLFFFQFNIMGLMVMVVAPGIAQGIYQNWKWPLEVAKELEIKKIDLSKAILTTFRIM